MENQTRVIVELADGFMDSSLDPSDFRDVFVTIPDSMSPSDLLTFMRNTWLNKLRREGK
ncbi:hypothetical protein HDU93_004979, partial [Gonapodya sp. JEL0774]